MADKSKRKEHFLIVTIMIGQEVCVSHIFHIVMKGTKQITPPQAINNGHIIGLYHNNN
jgi:hypothetical protein